MPPRGGEIEFDRVREVLYFLRDELGMNIRFVTFDQFQSVDSRQILRKRGFFTDRVSVDGKDSVPSYRALRDAWFNGRVLCPEHPIAFRELAQLEPDDRGVLDHPAAGGKDCADALAGCYTNLINQRSTWRAVTDIAVSRGESVQTTRRASPRPSGLARPAGRVQRLQQGGV
jgi:hypothetical protein